MALKSQKPDFVPNTVISSSEVEDVFSDIIDDLQAHEDKLGTGSSGHTHDGVNSRKISSSNVLFDNTGTNFSSLDVHGALVEADDRIAAIEEGSISASIDPGSDNTYDIGTSSHKYKTVFAGNVVSGVKSVSSNYTADYGEVVLVDASGGNVTITLPSPQANAVINVKKIDSSSNVITVSGGGATIDGQSSFSFSIQYESYTFVSDGTNWYII